MSFRLAVSIAALALGLSGCAHNHDATGFDGMFAGHDAPSHHDAPANHGPPGHEDDWAVTTHVDVAWGEAQIMPPEIAAGPQAVADTDGPYLLDSGDQLRIFVYGQPNLSRLYTVGYDGKISVPLIGNVGARGKTTGAVAGIIRARLGAEFVRDPQVTVDVQQTRPFFILGEVRSAGQYPYVPGMTVETAVAIGGGYTERASTRSFRITRRINGLVEQIEAPSDYVVRAGDTVFVYERFF